ncbi:MAG: hypothetical protein PHR30_09165 [Gallionellaceae bacterium]|nr:hypothetical protein [Gallionellaceae bacterium]MDD5365495.1 hypothetical protein [Gallionellaceae bacterium]
MKLWQKLLITLVVMLVASFAAGRLWLLAFDFIIPSYLAGVSGGLAAIPVWELLRWLEKK